MLLNKESYEEGRVDEIVNKWNLDNNDTKSKNAVIKVKARLVKYGIWNKTQPRLDNIEEMIKETGRDKILEIGLREYSRKTSKRFGVSESNITAKYTFMLKYEII